MQFRRRERAWRCTGHPADEAFYVLDGTFAFFVDGMSNDEKLFVTSAELLLPV